MREGASQSGVFREYKMLKRKLQLRQYVAWLFFVLFSLFLQLYIIAFLEIASTRDRWQWGLASLISIGIDQICFEMLPALAIAGFGVVQAKLCRCCQCLLCFMVSI